MSGIGISGIILLAIIALLLFGPNKLPELGRAFGRTLREFRKGANELIDDGEERKRVDVTADASQAVRPGQDRPQDDRRLPE